jgi:hypothetical protein
MGGLALPPRRYRLCYSLRSAATSASGTRAATVVSTPGREVTLSRPPISSARWVFAIDPIRLLPGRQLSWVIRADEPQRRGGSPAFVTFCPAADRGFPVIVGHLWCYSTVFDPQ